MKFVNCFATVGNLRDTNERHIVQPSVDEILLISYLLCATRLHVKDGPGKFLIFIFDIK
jgi:hypothetical protein